MMKCILWLAVLLLSPAFAADDWGPVQFLVGHWSGEGDGKPGQGAGEFSFTPDVQGKVLVRKSFAEYPAAGGQPASRHDDLMIVYRDETSHQLRAIYFDNEEHVIQYSVKPGDGRVVFASEGGAATMRYRLTYINKAPGKVGIQFEIAPPGKDFTTYLEAGARRDKSN